MVKRDLRKFLGILEKYTLPVLAILCLLVISLTLKVTFRKYDRFEFGKYDLGNMNQLAFNTSRGRFMEITDQFGTNMPRWGMSHVDPLLVIFTPIYWAFPDPRVLLVAQAVLFVGNALLFYLLGLRLGLGRITSFLVGAAYLAYPAVGSVLVMTTFHGITVATTFFLLLVLQLPRWEKEGGRRHLLLLVLLTLLTLLGKEEIGFNLGLFFAGYQLYRRKFSSTLSLLAVLSVVWSLLCFLVIIPSYSAVRKQGLLEFVGKLDNPDAAYESLVAENYFLYRYDHLGDSYTDIVLNVFKKPKAFWETLSDPQKVKTLRRVFYPVLLTPLLSPLILMGILPDLAINLLAKSPEDFSIENHRVTMVVAFVFLAIIFFLRRVKKESWRQVLALGLVLGCLWPSLTTKDNRLFFLLQDKLERIGVLPAQAAAETGVEFHKILDDFCADYVVGRLDPDDAVTAPQPLGAKTSSRRINALFPGGWYKVDVVIGDVASTKLFSYLGLRLWENRRVFRQIYEDHKYVLTTACNRLLVFERLGEEAARPAFAVTKLGNKYPTAPIGQLLKTTDFYEAKLPEVVSRREPAIFKYIYAIGEESYKDSLHAYTVLFNPQTSLQYEFVNFGSFALTPHLDWDEGTPYEETVSVLLPEFVTPGDYEVYFGLFGARGKDENLKVGEVTVID